MTWLVAIIISSRGSCKKGLSAAPVDQLITDEETRPDELAVDARDTQSSAEELAADLVLQISIRVRWIREFMIAGIHRMIEHTQSTFADKATSHLRFDLRHQAH